MKGWGLKTNVDLKAGQFLYECGPPSLDIVSRAILTRTQSLPSLSFNTSPATVSVVHSGIPTCTKIHLGVFLSSFVMHNTRIRSVTSRQYVFCCSYRYVGEVITMETCEKRLRKQYAALKKSKNMHMNVDHYFMTLDDDMVLARVTPCHSFFSFAPVCAPLFLITWTFANLVCSPPLVSSTMRSVWSL